MAELFGREIVVTVETVQIRGLRASFDIRKTLRKEPNTAKLSIWNLASTTRKALQKENAQVIVEAGYAGNIAQIWSGTLRNVTSKREGADWITSMETGDGEHKLRSARVNKSFANATFEMLLKEAADKLGVGIGNAAELARRGQFQSSIRTLSTSVTLNGMSRDVIDRLCRSAGFEWSVQDGQLQLLERGKALARTAVLLSPSTGLLGSPERGDKGIVKAKSLLQPEIFPGRKVRIESQQFSGLFRVETASYDGDTHAEPWWTEIEAKPVAA